jgi:DNA polymerase III delta prime subunit
MARLAGQFFKRTQGILEAEGVTYDKAVVAEIIQKYFPVWRRVLNELQRYSATGSIDSGILANMQESSIKELLALMKDKNFTEVRKWIKNNIDTDVNVLYNQFYETIGDFCSKNSIPELVLIIARYQYQNAFSANPEINFAAFVVEVMHSIELI